MNTQETNNHLLERETWVWETCAVCGGSVEPGRGAARINHRGSTINLCGPCCLAAFAEEPDPYLARLAKFMRQHGLGAAPIEAGETRGNGRFETLLFPASGTQPTSGTPRAVTFTDGKPV
jgi:ribosomal protein L24E